MGKKVGLAVMRMQPMHNGHTTLIKRMLDEMDYAIVGLGSVQEKNTYKNPYSPIHRMNMVENIFGDLTKEPRLRMIGLKDIGGTCHRAWSDFVFGEIEKKELPRPTHYYAGSEFDAEWFRVVESLTITIVNRLTESICMSGTEVRDSIAKGNSIWKQCVPFENIEYIQSNFPSHLVQY